MHIYRHTQPGTATRIAAAGALVAAVLTLMAVGPLPVLWLLVALALLGLLVFGSMTVEVHPDRLAFWFGVGWPRRTFSISEITACSAVRNPWWYGWGIHLTPFGWLYNVGGSDAVQLELSDGRRLRVGTDEPERLCEAIRGLKGSPRPPGR